MLLLPKLLQKHFLPASGKIVTAHSSPLLPSVPEQAAVHTARSQEQIQVPGEWSVTFLQHSGYGFCCGMLRTMGTHTTVQRMVC